MAKEIQTWRTEKLASAHCRAVVDRCGNFLNITGTRLGLHAYRKGSLDLLASRYWPGLPYLPVWIFKIGQKKQPQDHFPNRKKTLLICLPGMAQLPVDIIHDRLGDNSQKVHTHT